MKRAYRHIIWFVAILLLVAGCTTSPTDELDAYNSNEVRLWANLGRMNASLQSTRGTAGSTSGIITPTTDTLMKIGMARIDQEEPAYPAFVMCGEPIEAEMNLPDPANSYLRQISFTNSAQFYRNATDFIKFAAWHPWHPDKDGYFYSSTADATTVSIPVTGESDIMYGDVITGNMQQGFDVMDFQHALCIYRIYVYSMSENGEDLDISQNWGEIETLLLRDLPTTCHISLPTKEDEKYTISYEGEKDIIISDPSNNIHFNPCKKIPSGFANRHLLAECVAAPPENEVLDIVLTMTNSTIRHPVSVARNFKAGYAYNIVLRFSEHGLFNAEVSVDEWKPYNDDIKQEVSIDMYYNLSYYERSNCYMINAGNCGYCFDGTTKGNGNGGIVGVTDTSLNPGYIDIIWNDLPEHVSLASHHLSEGKVMVNVAGVDGAADDDLRLPGEGNVLIAAYDEEGGNIIWTWHLWLTDQVEAQGYSNGYVVQDRNLGALSDHKEDGELTHGLFYQWGRPTPFRKPSVGTPLEARGERVTMEEAIANPTTLYGTGLIHWLTEDAEYPNNLWGCHHGGDHLEPEKTLYDPCPPGYHVASVRMWEHISEYEKENGFTQNGVNLSISGNDVWYPHQGRLDSDATFVTEDVLHLWSSSISHESDTEAPYLLRYHASKQSDVFSGDIDRAHGHPIRCISTNTQAVVRDLSASQTANCYMIHRNGYYKFRATTRGNGVGSLLPLGGTNTAEIHGELAINIRPVRVDVLWWQGDFTEVTGDASDVEQMMPIELLNGGTLDKDGYVTLHIDEFHKGNVILAGYDYDNEILWTWHIWLTDKPADLISGNYTMLDRFLGATFAPTIADGRVSFASDKERMATYGFYYQWGRKDPIIGPPSKNAGSENLSTTATTSASSEWWVKDVATGTWSKRNTIDIAGTSSLAEVTRNPMHFYRSQTLAGRTTSQWFPETFADGYTNVAMWGYAVADYSINGQTFSKTMYDPCPPGYRTPFHFSWRYDGTYKYAEGDAGAATTTLSSELTYDSERLGMVTDMLHFDNIWYPYVGYRYPTTGGYTAVGTEGHMQTGMPMGQYNTRSFYYNKSVSGQYCSSGTDAAGHGSAYAKMIRCIKD